MLGFGADPERCSPPSPLPPVPLLSVLGRSGNNRPSVISTPRPAASPLRFSPSLWCHDLHLGSSLPLRGGHAPLPLGQREPSSCTRDSLLQFLGPHPLQSCCWSLHPHFVSFPPSFLPVLSQTDRTCPWVLVLY